MTKSTKLSDATIKNININKVNEVLSSSIIELHAGKLDRQVGNTIYHLSNSLARNATLQIKRDMQKKTISNIPYLDK